MPAVVFATCTEVPDGDEDAERLGAALAGLGVPSRWAAWDDPAEDWSTGLVVIRSTWDYPARRDQFLTWVRALPLVANAAAVIEWNTDKTYLRDLAAAGVATVPTTFAAPGERPELVPGEVVVKPSVGAGSRGVGRFTAARAAEALAHARELQEAGRTVLVQPYVADVDTAGEAALIYLDGQFSHAIRKGPMLPGGVTHPVGGWELYVAEEITARPAQPAELAVAAAALDYVRDRFGADQLYTRVDLLPGADGPVIVELELTEPSLFLQHGRYAGTDPIGRFAAAIAARL